MGEPVIARDCRGAAKQEQQHRGGVPTKEDIYYQGMLRELLQRLDRQKERQEEVKRLAPAAFPLAFGAALPKSYRGC